MASHLGTHRAGARTPQERVEDISRRLACPICDGESVFESRNADSQAIRIEIARQVDTGTVSDDQIINFIEQRFGSKVLLVPRATGIDALVWALPVAALICAVVGLGFAFHRWKTAADTVPDDEDRHQDERDHCDCIAGNRTAAKPEFPPGRARFRRCYQSSSPIFATRSAAYRLPWNQTSVPAPPNPSPS